METQGNCSSSAGPLKRTLLIHVEIDADFRRLLQRGLNRSDSKNHVLTFKLSIRQLGAIVRVIRDLGDGIGMEPERLLHGTRIQKQHQDRQNQAKH